MAIEQATAWQPFLNAVEAVNEMSLRGIFTGEADRRRAWTVTHGGLALDLSRQFISHEVLSAYASLYAERDVVSRITAMFDGEPVNVTENRAVTHGRSRKSPRDHLRRAFDLSESVRSGGFHGATGMPFTHVINIGIGGSDLGPALVVSALADFCDGPSVSFVSNIDPSGLDDVMAQSDPATTLVVVSSKTMTTIETMSNADRARAWIADAVGTDAATSHFVAVTASPKRAVAWGIPEEHVLQFDESIGGRFSVSSATGFPAMVALGERQFQLLLDGMQEMDDNVRSASLSENLSALHALTVVANSTALGMNTHVVVPYSHRLSRLPAFLQQVVMESNGKSVDEAGEPVASTSPVVWGAEGTNGQHAFFQLLHQGTTVVPVDFVVVNVPHEPGKHPQRDRAHRVLVANARAQADVLAFGRTYDETIATGASASDAAHRVFPGNRPSTTVTLESVNPSSIGALIALYENSVAIQGWLWGINSFDQFGVELGKSVALEILQQKP